MHIQPIFSRSKKNWEIFFSKIWTPFWEIPTSLDLFLKRMSKPDPFSINWFFFIVFLSFVMLKLLVKSQILFIPKYFGIYLCDLLPRFSSPYGVKKSSIIFQNNYELSKFGSITSKLLLVALKTLQNLFEKIFFRKNWLRNWKCMYTFFWWHYVLSRSLSDSQNLIILLTVIFLYKRVTYGEMFMLMINGGSSHSLWRNVLIITLIQYSLLNLFYIVARRRYCSFHFWIVLHMLF